MQIDDGKHRLTAAYQHWKETGAIFEIEIYWGKRLPGNGEG